MKIILYFFLSFSTLVLAQKDTPEYLDALAHQQSENEKFTNLETTILTPEDFKTFQKLDFYTIDLKFRVQATFIRTPNEIPFEMATTTERIATEVKYGELHFEIDGKALQLNLYQSVPPLEDPEYVDYLFLPFTDLTGGEGSYAGGRFLDARIPKGDTMVIDFNKAYNPYCAYNSKYSCPIPPLENNLDIAIKAGVKAFSKHD